MFSTSPLSFVIRFEDLEGAPYAFNAGGVKDVQARARANTNAATLAAHGGGGLFPLFFSDRTENGNYLETNEVAKRTTPCGDPRLVRNERLLVKTAWSIARLVTRFVRCHEGRVVFFTGYFDDRLSLLLLTGPAA